MLIYQGTTYLKLDPRFNNSSLLSLRSSISIRKKGAFFFKKNSRIIESILNVFFNTLDILIFLTANILLKRSTKPQKFTNTNIFWSVCPSTQTGFIWLLRRKMHLKLFSVGKTSIFRKVVVFWKSVFLPPFWTLRREGGSRRWRHELWKIFSVA